MAASTKAGYHHGDLRTTLLAASMRALEAGETFSMRSIAREAGVSATAPYRHFTDRDALESALAAQGLRDLTDELTSGRELPHTPEELRELAVAYVEFAMDRPALFRLMFGNACDTGSAERVEAADAIHELLRAAMAQVYPESDAAALATAGWALAHGMAYLYMDGKLHAESTAEIADHVRTAFTAITSTNTSS